MSPIEPTEEKDFNYSYSQEVLIEDVYNLHRDWASKYLSSFQHGNPLSFLSFVFYRISAELTNIPVVSKVICAAYRHLLNPGANYTIALNHEKYRRALDLAHGGADLSTCDAKGKNLVELLYGYDDEMFKEAVKLALKQNPSFMINNNETVVDFLLGDLAHSNKFSSLLQEAIVIDGTFNPTHPQCQQLLNLSILMKQFELFAVLIEKGVSFDATHLGHLLAKKLSVPLSKLSPPLDLGVLKPYATDLTEKAENGSLSHLKNSRGLFKTVASGLS